MVDKQLAANTAMEIWKELGNYPHVRELSQDPRSEQIVLELITSLIYRAMRQAVADEVTKLARAGQIPGKG